MNILFSVFQSMELQTPKADSRAKDQREEAENENTRYRRESTDRHWGR